MTIKIKDKKLYDVIMRKVDYHYDMAIKYFKEGKTVQAEGHEALGDKLYAKWYNNIFEVV